MAQIKVLITFDTDTQRLNFEFPSNFVLALGMLESARECMLANQVRPAVIPNVLAAGVPLPKFPRGD